MTQANRQELYDRIRKTSLDEVVLEEMIRFGFWPEGRSKETLPEDLIRRRGELRREISEMAAQSARYRDPDKAIREIMKTRMEEAKARRVETKRRKAEERNARARAWHARQQREITHLGDTGSAALENTASDADRLAANGLPRFDDLGAVAAAMGISVNELRFLTYNRRASRVSHYRRFRIPKKTGGLRTLSAPMPRLKRAQYWLLDAVLMNVEPHEAAHGFRPGHSIVTNARPHVGKAVVINLDLKDFFPSIGYRRVKGLFAALGYAEAQAAVFALLATETPTKEIALDGQRWHVASGERVLPQGAPTSPAITNLLCRKLDRRLTGAARKFGFAYTRYADDLTFSCAAEEEGQVRKLLWSLRQIVADEGFEINEDKTRIMRRGARQEVTGLTVNERVGVSRAERRRFRAHLHNAARDGGATRPFRSGNPAASALGYAQFLHMVHGEDAAGLTGQARALFGAGGSPRRRPSPLRAGAKEGAAPAGRRWEPTVAPPRIETPPPLPEPSRPATLAPPARPPAAAAVPRSGVRRGDVTARPDAYVPPPLEQRARQGHTVLRVVASVAMLPLLILPIGPLICGVLLYLLWRGYWGK